MKFKHYRNQAIGVRLKAAAKRWKSADSSNTFERPQRDWFFPLLKKIGIHSLLLFPVTILYFGKDESSVLLTLLFPFLAATTLSNLFVIYVKPRGEERTYLLPFDDKTLDRQVRSQLVSPLIKGLFYATLYGAMSSDTTSPLVGAITGGSIFLGLIGVLTLSLLPRMSWLYSTFFFGSIALFFGAMVNEDIMAVLHGYAHFIPWFHALLDLQALAALLAFSIVGAWFSKSYWWGISPLNRTSYYETFGSPQNDYELDEEEFLEVSRKDSHPKSPQGSLEKFTWKSLDIKERAIVRAVGGTKTNFLQNWAISTMIGISLIWLSAFTWPIPLEEFKLMILAILIIWSSSKLLNTSGSSLRYLEGISLGPQAIGSQIQLLPLSLTKLEKLHWKEILPKAFLTSMSVTFCLSIWITNSWDLSLFPHILPTTFPTITILFWFPFWNSSINYWSPKRGSGFFRNKLLKLLILGGVLVITIPIFIPMFEPNFFVVGTPLFPPLISIIYLILIRIPLRSIIKDKRCDLMVQT